MSTGVIDEARCRTIIEQSPLAILRYAPDGSLIAANAAWESLWASSRALLAGYNLLDDEQAAALGLHDAFYRARAGQRVTVPPVLYDPGQHDHPGAALWIEGYMYAVPDADGSVAEVVFITQDVSERMTAATAVRESRARFRAISAASPVGIFVADLDGNCTYTNSRYQQIIGTTATAALGQPWYRHTHPVDQATAHTVWTTALAQQEPFALQLCWLHANETLHLINIQAAPIRDGLTLRGYVGTIEDITTREQAAQALRHSEQQVRQLNAELEQRVATRTAELEMANRELEAFAYSASHDLRAPVRSMQGFAELLGKRYGAQLDPTGHDYLERILKAGQRMNDLIDALLQLSRATRAPLTRVPVDLSALAHLVAAELTAADPSRAVTWVIAPALNVAGDPEWLRVLLENLLCNAWKFTAKQPTARIEVGQVQHPDCCTFFVRDNGAGFDMAHVAKLFRAFQRLHSTHEFSGTGVGLATVQRIVERHSGQVWAEGELGKGATFWFTLG